MASLEKWVDELQAAVDKLTKRVANAAASAFKPDISTPTDGQILLYDATAEKWENADLPASGVKITTSGNIGEFPASPAAGDLHYLLDTDGHQNASYRYDGEAWQQLTGFNYQLSDTEKISITSGYGLFEKIAASAWSDFAYVIAELGYQLQTGSGVIKKFFYMTEPIIIDPEYISGITVTGKYRNAALDATIDWTDVITQKTYGILMIGYGSDNDGNWLFWQLCRPLFVEPYNNALYQGNIVTKQGGPSGNCYLTSVKLNKVQPVEAKKKTTKKGGTK